MDQSLDAYCLTFVLLICQVLPIIFNVQNSTIGWQCKVTDIEQTTNHLEIRLI